MTTPRNPTIREAFPRELPLSSAQPKAGELYDPLEAITGIPAPKEQGPKPIAFRCYAGEVPEHYCAGCDPRKLGIIGNVVEIFEADGWTVETGGKPRSCFECGAEIVDPEEGE